MCAAIPALGLSKAATALFGASLGIQGAQMIQQNRAAISKVLQITTKNNIPTPVLSASFNWFNNLTSVDNPSNLIQAQRDFFGRHKVQKVDSSEDINIDWD